jgi:type 1 glutamine amidotransferase
MKTFLATALAIVASVVYPGSVAAQTPKKVLVVTVTAGFRHDSIDTAEQVLEKLGKESGAFTVDFVRQPPNQPRAPRKPKEPTDAEAAAFKEAEAKFQADQKAWEQSMKEGLTKLSADSLKNYAGVIFANTTGMLPLPDNQALIDWVKNGGAFIGMHSASDTFHEFKPYVDMLGGEFETHGAQATVDCLNQDPKHPACSHLEPVWNIHDEIYILKSFDRNRVHGLLTLDKHPNTKKPGDYPIAWCREVGSGKVFYTSLGHRIDVWQKDVYQKHVLGGIKWALGLSPGDGKPQTAKE